VNKTKNILETFIDVYLPYSVSISGLYIHVHIYKAFCVIDHVRRIPYLTAKY